jgi:hypothetical protein
MGQTYSLGEEYAYRVVDPKTPYEWSKTDMILDEKQLDDMEESIKEQLEADARHIEELLLRNGSYAVALYGRDILRVKLDPDKYKTSHGVLPRPLRVKCLMKYLKIPFTLTTNLHATGYGTIINRIFNVEDLHKSSA